MLASCAFDQIYRGGAVMPDPHGDPAVAQLIQADAAALGSYPVSELFPPASYRWEFPADGFVENSLFTADLHNFYVAISERNCPAVILTRFENAIMYDSVVALGAHDAVPLVYETFRANDRAAVIAPSPADLASAEGLLHGEVRYLQLGSAGSFNYGHWLIDDLSRLRAVDWLRAQDDARPICLLLTAYHSAIDQTRVEGLRFMLGGAIDIKLLERGKAYRIAELYFASPTSFHPVQKHPTAIADMVTRARSQLPPPDSPRRRLFVTRPEGGERGIENYGAVLAALDRRGFLPVQPESLSFAEQAAMFAEAEIVVGVMGAAMTNSAFCLPGTPTIYLAPSGWIEPFYFDLAQVRAHHYRVLYGASTQPEKPPYDAKFVIPVESLERALDAIGFPAA